MNELKYFISYSRNDTKEVTKIVKLLKKNSVKIYVDIDDILPAEKWRKRLDEMIFLSDVFIYMMSNSSLMSKECSKELELAEKYKKRIIPVVISENFDQSDVSTIVSSVNYLYCLEGDSTEIYESILSTINYDIPIIREHTRILTAARYWELSQMDESNLLRGFNLKKAIKWKNKPQNNLRTPLLDRFIKESEVSEQHEIQLQKDIEYKSVITQSKQLSESIKLYLKENSNIKLPDAVINILDGWEQDNPHINVPHDRESSFIFANAVLTLRQSESFISDGIKKIIINNHGDKIICVTEKNSAHVYDISTFTKIATLQRNSHYFPYDISFNHDGNYILTSPFSIDLKYEKDFVTLWDANTGHIISEFKTDWKNDEIFKVVLSKDSKYLITISGNSSYDKFEEGDAILWDVKSATVIKFISEGVLNVEFSDDSLSFTTKMLHQDKLKKWSSETGKEIPETSFVAMSKSIAVQAGGGNYHKIINLEDNSIISEMDSYLISSVRISPDSALIYAKYIHKLDIIDSSNGEILHTFNT